MRNSVSWDCSCIIGFGNHAKSKILPALENVGIKIGGIVSSKDQLMLPGVEIFKNVADAIKFLPSNTLFIISSPPKIHFSQAKELVQAGKDIFIEKPAFISSDDLVEINKLACKSGSLVVEMLMYLENKSVKKIINFLKEEHNQIKAIKMKFFIPSIPEGTFRIESDLGSSLLSDMGCYPLSILKVAGYKLANLNLDLNKKNLDENISFHILGHSKKILIDIKIGVSDSYQNSLSVILKDENNVFCEPFFYGRSGERKYVVTKNDEIDELKIFEEDAFELMFLKNKSYWVQNQKERITQMMSVVKNLERLGQQAQLY